MNESEDILAVRQRSIEWMKAWINRDFDKLDEIIGDEFILASSRSDGDLITKSMWLALAEEQIIGTSFVYDEFKVRIFGDAAVVNAVATQTAVAFGEEWSGKFLLTDVWIRKGGTWQVVTRHGSRPVSEK